MTEMISGVNLPAAQVQVRPWPSLLHIAQYLPLVCRPALLVLPAHSLGGPEVGKRSPGCKSHLVLLEAVLRCTQIGMGVPLHRIPDVRRMFGKDPDGSSPIDFERDLPVPPLGKSRIGENVYGQLSEQVHWQGRSWLITHRLRRRLAEAAAG